MADETRDESQERRAHERRGAPRVALAIDVVQRRGKFEYACGVTLNLSVSGMLIRVTHADEPPPVDTRLALRFRLPHRAQHLLVSARVVRTIPCDHGFDLAVELVDIDPSHRAALETFIEQYEPESIPDESAVAEPSLVVLSGLSSGKRLLIPPTGLVLGRASDDGLIADDVEASREHVRITLERDGRHAVEDLHSRNGTLVNGAKVQSAKLEDGDTIRIGTTMLEYRKGGGASTP